MFLSQNEWTCHSLAGHQDTRTPVGQTLLLIADFSHLLGTCQCRPLLVLHDPASINGPNCQPCTIFSTSEVFFFKVSTPNLSLFRLFAETFERSFVTLLCTHLECWEVPPSFVFSCCSFSRRISSLSTTRFAFGAKCCRAKKGPPRAATSDERWGEKLFLLFGWLKFMKRGGKLGS